MFGEQLGGCAFSYQGVKGYTETDVKPFTQKAINF